MLGLFFVLLFTTASTVGAAGEDEEYIASCGVF